MRKYESHDLEVHHIERVVDNYEKRLDGGNLLTVCERHHELAESGVISIDLLKKIAQEQEEKAGEAWSGIPPGSEV